ncbi:MAG: carnitinyl-CoA dehydratase [Bryobacterales bacterium]|jgi:enoyl-CoA hydratase|nr:carnitinyl-CoA dehydratase [Bryobacterales bacterium]
MSLDMWRAAAAVLDQFEHDSAVRVIVLTGAGGKAFVSGADISKFESERDTLEAVSAYNAAVDQFSKGLGECSKPTIAMIRGYCLGGGVGIAVCCDLRIANDAARFAVPAAKLGLGYGYTNVRRIMDLVGPQFVTEMLLTARQFDSAQAARIGLVNHVVPEAEIEKYVRDLAETIAGNAPLTIQAVKRIVRELRRDAEKADVAACDALVKQCFESADYREGRQAFLEKRKPIFRGV